MNRRAIFFRPVGLAKDAFKVQPRPPHFPSCQAAHQVLRCSHADGRVTPGYVAKGKQRFPPPPANRRPPRLCLCAGLRTRPKTKLLAGGPEKNNRNRRALNDRTLSFIFVFARKALSYWDVR